MANFNVNDFSEFRPFYENKREDIKQNNILTKKKLSPFTNPFENKVQGTRFLFHVIHITLENIFSLKIYNVVNSVKIIYSFTHSLISHTTRTHTT